MERDLRSTGVGGHCKFSRRLLAASGWTLRASDSETFRELAARIARLLHTTVESWLRMQAAVDLWEVELHPERLAGVQPINKRLLRAA